MIKRTPFFLIFLLPFLFLACGEDTEKTVENTFVRLNSTQTGISFENTNTETYEVNYMTYENIFNGGGVAVGDINNDGLDDIYFTGNMVSDKLYLNEGDMQFKDVTSTALNSDLAKEGWHTGVSMVDINHDGWLDIYVCRSGWYTDPNQRANLLFINNGDLTFTESAKTYGCLLYTSPSPRDLSTSRMPSSA